MSLFKVPRSPNCWIQKSSQILFDLSFLEIMSLLSAFHFKRLSLCYPILSWFLLSCYFLKFSLLFSFTDSYSSTYFLNTCLVLHSGYIWPLNILIYNLTVFYALMTFISVSLASVSLLSPHTSLCLLDTSTLTWLNYFPWEKKCMSSMISLAI